MIVFAILMLIALAVAWRSGYAELALLVLLLSTWMWLGGHGVQIQELEADLAKLRAEVHWDLRGLGSERDSVHD